MSLGDKVASAFGPSAKHNSKNGNDFFGEAYQPWASVCKISDATSNSGNAHPKNQLHSFIIVLRISVHSKLIHLRKKWTCETVCQLNCVSDLLHPHIHMSHMQLFFPIGS